MNHSAGSASQRLPDSRSAASTMPTTTPTAMATAAIFIVPTKPASSMSRCAQTPLKSHA